MKLLITACIVFAVTSVASATAPTPSKIVYEGKEYDLYENPMASFFDKHPEVEEPKSEIWSTGRGRCYIAVYQIETNHLVLKDITVDAWKDGVTDPEEKKSVKDAVTPDGKDMIVTNYSGILVLTHGEVIKPDRMGFGAFSLYSNYILLEIKKGKVAETRLYTHKQYEAFKDRQFRAYKGTPAYLADVKKFTSKDDSEEEIDALLREGFLYSTPEFLDKEEKSPNKISEDTGTTAPDPQD